MSTTPADRLVSPLKWHGGKHYLARRIVGLMPSHLHYVEPYAGTLAVLLAKDPDDVSEVANDLHGGLMNFWRVLQDPELFERFRRYVEAVPFGEGQWQEAQSALEHIAEGDIVLGHEPSVFWAGYFFVACRQSLAGRMEDFAPLSRNRTRRRMNEQASAWLSAVEGLPAVHARLKRVVLLRRPALDVIRSQDGPGTLYYLDPPYLHQTRAVADVYSLEMTEAEHRELLQLLPRVRGKVILSGYPSALYDEALAGWHRVCFDVPNNAAGGPTKGRETEVLWCNFRPATDLAVPPA